MAEGDVFAHWECQVCGRDVVVKEIQKQKLMYSCDGSISEGVGCGTTLFPNKGGSLLLRQKFGGAGNGPETTEQEISTPEAIETEPEPEDKAAEEDRQSEPGGEVEEPASAEEGGGEGVEAGPVSKSSRQTRSTKQRQRDQKSATREDKKRDRAARRAGA